MDPEELDRDNMYAPPTAPDALEQPDHERAEPWTIKSCLVAATRASLASPVFAWIGLGIIPSIPLLLDELGALESTATLGIRVLSLAITAVLSGGQLRIALALVRNEPANFMAFASYARLAPGFFLLSLPGLLPAVLGLALSNPANVQTILSFGFIPLSFAAVYLTYKLSLATYAWADSPGRVGRAASYSWRRTGANVGKFLMLFLVTGLPSMVSYGLTTLAPLASTLFTIATLPFVTLCWTHAYDAGLDTEDEPGQPSDG